MRNLLVPPPSSRLFLLLLGLALALPAFGCRSVSGPGSASFASVTISNHTVADIATTTAQVFAEEGYIAHGTGEHVLVFDKEAARATTISRDGLVAAQSGARTLHRVRVHIVALGDGTHRLQCEAFLVSGAGDSFFEEEHRLSNARRGPYQSLLDRVAKQLK